MTPFLGVPLRDGENMTGMVGLASKRLGYDQADLEAIESLSVAVAEVLSPEQAAPATEAAESRRTLDLGNAASIVAANRRGHEVGG